MTLTPGDKLITALLCDIAEKVGAKNDLDPTFIKKAIFHRQEWALRWELQGIFEDSDFETPAEVKEVCDILDMWDMIETYYKGFDNDQKATVAQIAKPFGENPTFMGFDGNNETTHYGACLFLIKDMNRFTKFADRGDLNSHMPSVPIYRRMLRVYESIKAKYEYEPNYTPEDIGELLKAKHHDYVFED